MEIDKIKTALLVAYIGDVGCELSNAWEYQNDEGYYETKCGKSFYFSDDGMFLSEEEQGKLQDGFKWCPYCGKTIKPIYPPEEEEEE